MEEKLIEAVHGRAFLYNTFHKDYMKSKLKLRIWEEVAKEIGVKCGKFLFLLFKHDCLS